LEVLMFANAKVDGGIHDAEPSDIYVDEAGKLWRVVGVVGEPSVIVEEIETKTPDNPVRKNGGVSGLMWRGWKRIHRPEKPKPDLQKFVASHPTYDRHYDSQGYCDNPGRGY
jgi:hypothetical protein